MDPNILGFYIIIKQIIKDKDIVGFTSFLRAKYLLYANEINTVTSITTFITPNPSLKASTWLQS